MKHSLIFVLTFFWASLALAANPQVLIKTSEGDMTVELLPERAPITVKNFLTYVKKGHYDGTVFHRVIPNFMIQGGGFNLTKGALKEKATDKPIKNEASNGLSNARGTIAMARTSDPNSATSQFFINHVHNKGLDYPAHGGGYAVFGKLVSGLDVLDKIAAVPTGMGKHELGHPMQNVPTKEVKIISAKLVEGNKAAKAKPATAPKKGG